MWTEHQKKIHSTCVNISTEVFSRDTYPLAPRRPNKEHLSSEGRVRVMPRNE